MPETRCPGQDQRYWKPEDIFTAACPHCRGEIEFWKDEPTRVCPACGKEVRNPKQDFGCAKWCQHAAECLEPLSGESPGGTLNPGEAPK
jgi:endogenous inhibitor of DNA gyrase (YacG/DUF329 family)